MRRPNREINIFNLSMLDVICGALGAFLLLFLIAGSQAGSRGGGSGATPPAPKPENLFLFMSSWEQPGTDFDLWVRKPDGSWAGPQGRRLFDRIVPNFEFGNVDGSRRDTTWYETYRRVDPSVGPYLVVGHLRQAPAGAPAPVDLRGFVSVDLPKADTSSNASLKPARFGAPGEVRVIALVGIARDGRVQVVEFDDRWDGQALPARVQARVDEMQAARR